jgi:hypothetical protein
VVLGGGHGGEEEVCLCGLDSEDGDMEVDSEGDGAEVMEVMELGESDEEGEVCVHHHGSVYSITALCQGCHANRSLEVV